MSLPFPVPQGPRKVHYAGAPSATFEIATALGCTVWDAQPDNKWSGAFPAATFGWGRINCYAMKNENGEVQGFHFFYGLAGGLRPGGAARLVTYATPFWSTFDSPANRTATMRLTLMTNSWDPLNTTWNNRPAIAGPQYDVAVSADKGWNDSFSGGGYLIEIPETGGPWYGIHYQVVEPYEPGPPKIGYYVQGGRCEALLLEPSG